MIFQNFPLHPCRNPAMSPGGNLFCCNLKVQDGLFTKWEKVLERMGPEVDAGQQCGGGGTAWGRGR